MKYFSRRANLVKSVLIPILAIVAVFCALMGFGVFSPKTEIANASEQYTNIEAKYMFYWHDGGNMVLHTDSMHRHDLTQTGSIAAGSKGTAVMNGGSFYSSSQFMTTNTKWSISLRFSAKGITSGSDNIFCTGKYGTGVNLYVNGTNLLWVINGSDYWSYGWNCLNTSTAYWFRAIAICDGSKVYTTIYKEATSETKTHEITPPSCTFMPDSNYTLCLNGQCDKNGTSRTAIMPSGSLIYDDVTIYNTNISDKEKALILATDKARYSSGFEKIAHWQFSSAATSYSNAVSDYNVTLARNGSTTSYSSAEKGLQFGASTLLYATSDLSDYIGEGKFTISLRAYLKEATHGGALLFATGSWGNSIACELAYNDFNIYYTNGQVNKGDGSGRPNLGKLTFADVISSDYSWYRIILKYDGSTLTGKVKKDNGSTTTQTASNADIAFGGYTPSWNGNYDLCFGGQCTMSSSYTIGSQDGFLYHEGTNVTTPMLQDIRVYAGAINDTEETAIYTYDTENYVYYTITNAVNTAGYGTVDVATVDHVKYNGASVSSNKITYTKLDGTTTVVTATATAATAQYSYAFSSFSNYSTINSNRTVTANFTRTTNNYTVTVAVAAASSGYGTVSVSSITSVPYGTAYSTSSNVLTVSKATPATSTATPTTDTAQYHYAFSSWSSTSGTVTGNITINASFTRSVREYTVTVTVGQAGYGTVSSSSITSVPYGTAYSTSSNVLTVSKATPATSTATATTATAQYSYAFDYWSSTSGTVTGNVTITANFSRATRTYTVTIAKGGDGASASSISQTSVTGVPYGTVLTSSSNTVTINGTTVTATPGTATAQYTYGFSSWTNGTAKVTGALTVTANFSRTTNTYTVTITKGGDGASASSISRTSVTAVPYGTVLTSSSNTVTINGTTVTATPGTQTAQYTYGFSSWTNGTATVTGALTVTANFSRTTRSYVITFNNDDGTQIRQDTLLYGAMPECDDPSKTPPNENFEYSFDGWDHEIVAVVGTATYTATYVQDVTFAFQFASNMVLQRGKSVNVYGFGENGNTVTVTFNGQTKSATVSNNEWLVTLDAMTPLKHGEGKTLTATDGTSTKTLTSVLVGDVWLASGQSNMVYPFSTLITDRQPTYDPWDMTTEKYNTVGLGDYLNYTTSEYSNVRIYDGTRYNQQDSVDRVGLKPFWTNYDYGWGQGTCLDDFVGHSAYAIGFALAMQNLNPSVPVGIVLVAVGGSSIEQWLSADTIDEYDLDMHYTAETKKASGLYNGMMYPVRNFTVNGLLWYQGEADMGSNGDSATTQTWVNQWYADMIGLVDQMRDEHGSSLPVVCQQIVQFDEWVPARYIRQKAWDLMDEIDYFYTVSGIGHGEPYDVDPVSVTNDIHPVDKYGTSAEAANIAQRYVYKNANASGLAAYPTAVYYSGNDVIIDYGTADAYKKLTLRSGTTVNNLEAYNGSSWVSVSGATLADNRITIAGGKTAGYTKVRYAQYNVMMTGATTSSSKFEHPEFNSANIINLYTNDYVAAAPYQEIAVTEGSMGTAMTIGEEISMTFTFMLAKGYSDPSVTVLYNGRTIDVDVTENADGSYSFKVPSMAPQDMNNTIKVYSATATEEGRGEVPLTFNWGRLVDGYSARDYLMALKDAYKGVDDDIAALAINALNYGAAAQTYLSHETNDLANKSVTAAEQTAYAIAYNATDVANNSVKTTSGTATAASWRSAQLYFESKVGLRANFVADTEIEGTLTVELYDKNDNLIKTYTRDEMSTMYMNVNQTIYTVTYGKISVTEVKDAYKFIVKIDGVQVSKDMTYNVYAGIKAYADKGDNYASLVKALYSYTKAAENLG